jgi:hypothetical protein
MGAHFTGKDFFCLPSKRWELRPPVLARPQTPPVKQEANANPNWQSTYDDL